MSERPEGSEPTEGSAPSLSPSLSRETSLLPLSPGAPYCPARRGMPESCTHERSLQRLGVPWPVDLAVDLFIFTLAVVLFFFTLGFVLILLHPGQQDLAFVLFFSFLLHSSSSVNDSLRPHTFSSPPLRFLSLCSPLAPPPLRPPTSSCTFSSSRCSLCSSSHGRRASSRT